MACRCTRHSRETGKCLSLIILRGIGVQLVGVEIDFRAHCSYPARICVDDSTADGNASRKTQVCGSLFAKISNKLTGRQIIAIL
jgi:hypothetical protein